MSLEQLRAEIKKLSPAERGLIRRDLFDELWQDPFGDPVLVAELERRAAEMEQGINVVTQEEVYARVRAAGGNV